MFICSGITPSVAVDTIKQSSMPISNGNTLYVGGTGEGNYSNIQDAVDDAVDGDTVFVFDDSSPYYENIVIKKSIYLKGEDRDKTVIDGDENFMVVSLEEMALVEHVSVSGFTMQNGRIGVHYSTGINNIDKSSFSLKCKHTASASFYDNILINNEIGIVVGWWSENIGIFGNKITSNKKGIVLDHCSWSIGIHENTVAENDYGICIDDSPMNDISDNIIISNKYDGISLSYYSNCNTITRNTIYDNAIGINLSNSCGNFIDYNTVRNSYYSIYLLNSDVNYIQENIIAENTDGIYLYDSSYNSITSNNISKNDDGIYIYDSNRNTIDENFILNNNVGISLMSSSSNTVMGNTIFDNLNCGINLNSSQSNTIKGNYISNNVIGIFLQASSHNIIADNNISDNEEGIYLTYFGDYDVAVLSSNNTILKNNFLGNERDAFFIDSFWNRWKHNYWNRPRILPKMVFGKVEIFYRWLIPWIQFDWHPAKEPYDIKGVI